MSHSAGAHEYEDEIVVGDPPPKRPASALQWLLETVKREHPHQWARIRRYREKNSAYAAVRRLNATEEWEAEVRNEPGAGAWLYVRFGGPEPVDNPSVSRPLHTDKSTEKRQCSTRSPQAKER